MPIEREGQVSEFAICEMTCEYRETEILFERFPDGWLVSFRIAEPVRESLPDGLKDWCARALDSWVISDDPLDLANQARFKGRDPVEALWREAKSAVDRSLEAPSLEGAA